MIRGGETRNKKGTRGLRVVEEQKAGNEILRVTGTGRNEKKFSKNKKHTLPNNQY